MNVRLTYKMLKLMEEQMTIYRMKMHPDRLAFKIFTGAASPMERQRIVRAWRREMEKLTSVDQTTEKMISEYGPWSSIDDIYFPVGEGDNVSDIQKFPGSGNSMAIFDVEYMRDLFFAGMRVPKGYMGFEDSQGYRSDTTLSQQSIKFARGVKNFQKNSVRGWVQMAKIHLSIMGIDPNDPKNAFTLALAPVAFLEEAQKSQQALTRFQTVDFLLQIGERLAMVGLNPTVWVSYVLTEYGGFTDEDIKTFFIEGQPVPLPIEAPPMKDKITEEQKKQVDGLILNDKDFAYKIAALAAENAGREIRNPSIVRSAEVKVRLPEKWEKDNDSVKGTIEKNVVLGEQVNEKVMRKIGDRWTKFREDLKKIVQECEQHADPVTDVK
jgi:hypothetical protein